MKKSRIISLLSATALVTMMVVAVPTTAQAAGPLCDGKAALDSCQGVTSDSAPYVMQVPGNFNGTLVLYSHGYRYNIDIPTGIPLIGGYKVTNTPQPGPLVGSTDTSVMKYLLSNGFAIAGSGFARQGWNADSGVATDVELIGIFKKQFPATTHVVAWGESLGGFITQALAETHPELVDAVAPMCMAAGTVENELTMAGDFLWGMKTFFDPTIKAGNYASDAEAYADLIKVFTVMGKIQAAMSSGAWPDTSSATGKALAAAGIPVRSALLLIGLMSGISTQSAHFDSISGPEGALKLAFPLAISPALAILENGTNAAALGVLVTRDVEQQSGGAIYDNTKTDYAARVTDESVVFNAALGGDDAINAMLGGLSAANPGAPRAVGNAAAVTKMRALLSHTGKINVPTITMVGVADPVTPAGASQWLADQYAIQYAAEKAKAYGLYKTTHTYASPQKKLLSIWSTTPSTYTTFDSKGTPITSTPAAPGTNHCNFTTAQYLVVAKELTTAGTTGKFLPGGQLYYLLRTAKNLSVDRFFRAPLLKFYQ
ncbi:MAG TPA: alpha/beta hydrolase [Candidatus Nanopelagicaceae bacterium]